MRCFLFFVLLLVSVSEAKAQLITFDTPFNIFDSIAGEAVGLNASENLTIDTNEFRFSAFSLPRFDPSLGELNAITFSVVFDSSEADIPVSFSNPAGGTTTADFDQVSLARGFVVGVETGFARPLVIDAQSQTIELDALNSNGFLTGTTLDRQISIPTGGVGFAEDLIDRVTRISLDDGINTFSFIGDERFELRFRTINQLQLSLDQDNLNLEVSGGTVEYSGVISVTYEFTPVSQPVLCGDIDTNGVVNFLDIPPFISLLSSNTFQAEADCDNDGAVTFLDIPPFIAALAGT